MEEKDASRIPDGVYCYTYVDGKRVNCPFWGRDPSRPQQESGFCTFLDIRDWDEGAGIPLLWDQVKECEINDNKDWEDYVD